MKRNFSLPFPSGLWAGAVLTAAFAAGCIPSSPPPASDPSSTGVPTFGAGDMPPGTRVQVARQGQWYPAVIVQPLGDGHFLVHYDNTGTEWNEAVGPDRVKPLSAGAGGPARDYHAGEKVLVTYQQRLLFADVVTQVSAESWRVHYDGFGAEAGETVGPDRLRRPFTGASGHAPGESVMVDVKGQLVAGKVLAASAADHWLVRFEAFGPQYDQEVGIDRIRAASSAVTPPPRAVEPPPPVAAKPEAKPEPKSSAKPEVKVVEKPKPKPAVVEAAPAVPSGPPAVGEAVLVSTRGAWFAAVVTAVGAEGVKVKFADGSEEEALMRRVLRDPGALKGLRFQPGQLVLIDYKGVWVPGKVTKQDGKDYKIRFDGQGPEGDEVIPAKRIRPR